MQLFGTFTAGLLFVDNFVGVNRLQQPALQSLIENTFNKFYCCSKLL